MLFDDLIRRRVASLLQPWLREEPELEMKLGFLGSHGIVKNLRFDTSVLNQLIDESTRLSFKDVTTEHISIRMSYWSTPAFTIEIRGIHVTLSVREQTEEGSAKRMQQSKDTSLDDIKKTLSLLDPEGTALHDVLERISATTSTNWLKTSLLNLIIKYCRLQMLGVHLHVQVPFSDDSFMCSLEANEFNAESKPCDHGCLLRGFASGIIFPLKESSLTLQGRGFGIRLKSKDKVSQVISSTDMSTCLRLKDLQLVHFNLCVPELNFSFSPVDLALIVAIDKSLSVESICARNGRQLWKLAAGRIGSLVSTYRFSLHKLVGAVCIWLRYVNTYEYLLLLVGYSVDNLLKRSVVMMSRDNKFSSSVKHHWKVITEIEKKLPAEAIARARRIARFRAALHAQFSENTNTKSLVNNDFKFFSKILQLLVFVWKFICFVFYSFVHFFCLRTFAAKYPGVEHLGIVSEESCQVCCFRLNLGKVSITVSSKNEVQLPIDEKLKSLGISRLDLLSFCLTLDALFLIYNEDICEQSLSISCGHLKFMSSSVIGTPVMEGSKKNFFSSSKGHLKGRVNDSKTIVWGEPAKMFPISKDCRTGTSKHTEGGCVPFLEEFLGQMWSSWNKSCMIFEENEIQHLEKPCLLFEIKYFLTDSGLRNPNSGFWKCGLTVGKLNFALGYSSILSIALVCRQVQYALCWPVGDGRARVLPHSSQSIGNSPENNWDSKYSWCASRMKMEMLRILPEKHIQLGVLIAGPHIRMSLRTEDFCSGNEYVNYIINQDDLHLAFDFHNIELVVSPTLKSELASMAGYPGLDDLGCLGLTEPQAIEIPRSDNENYISQGQISLGAYVRVNGLNVYLDDTSQNQQCQVFVVRPITIQLSTLREYLHSFSSTVVAFSAAFCGVATGFTALLYMDELSAFFQVVGGLYSVAEYAFIRFDSLGSVPHQQLMTQDMLFARPENQTTARRVPLISKSTLLVIKGTFDLKSMDIVLHKSRKSPNVESFMNTFDDSRRNFLAEYDLPDYGIWISVRQIFVEISCEEEKAEVLVGLSGIQSIIFRYQHQTGKNIDLSELRNILPQPRNCLYEMSLSNCTFTVSLGSLQNASSPGSVNDGFDGSTSGSKTLNLQENSTSAIVTEQSTVQSLSFDQKLGVASAIPGSASNYWLVINVVLTEIFIARCSVKNVLLGAHQLKKLQSSLYVGGEFQTISWGMEGVCVFLEITALSTLVCCFASYLHCVTNIISIISSSEKLAEIDEPSVNMTEPNDSHVEEYAQGMHNTSQQAKWELLEAFTMDLSQCSLVLVFQDESSGVRELVLEADARLNLEVANMKSLFLFDLSRLSILSQILHKGLEEEEEVKIPHFSSIASKDISSDFVSGDSAAALQHRNGNLPVFDDASSSSDAVSQKEPSANNCVTELFRLCNQHCILKQLGAIVSVEKSMQEDDNSPLFLNHGWVGSGSVSGFDMTISLSEIQMILSIDVSFLEVSKKDTTSNAKQRQRYNNPESDRSLEEIVPDGAIVAIQDVHQHIYFAVESVEDKYILSGAIHYSLVGERSLFRVKYHRQKKWRSSVLLFSLISVHAKSVSGEPLQLNYRPGSGFVDISSINDSEWGLWSLLSYKPESYEGDIDWEPCNQLAKNTFYLVNKKNDCAVAFVDGVPEFVRKPGNPFKFKVFQDMPPPRDSVMLGTCSVEASGTSLQRSPDVDIGGTSLRTGILPQVDVTIKKVSLTIVDEISDTRDKFPLLRGCIDDIHLIVQNFSSKARVISTLTAVLTYFDAQRNLWRDLVPPVEMCLFYRSCFQVQASETVLDRVPVHFYFRINELDISLTELSLDILLFVVGKLNLAGPFSVRSSIFLANCCKVENQSGLNLICQFNDKQEVTIARKQSAFIFLRQLATGNQASEKAPFVSIQLAVLGVFSTSPIHLSFLQAKTLAWRTRIVSLQDSKAYPGPFLVVDISRKTEDGLKIVVSPLIKIHNETEFSMELRFQRPQQNEAEFASVLLKSGDTIDDSMAVFDALNMSGGLKKALMSLSVGNFLFSFRPEMTDGLKNFKKSISVQWSDDLKGGKAVRLSGLFDKLSYKVWKAFSVASLKCSFSTAVCSLKSEDGLVSNMYFLLQSITKDVPVIQPDKSGDVHNYRNSPVALQEQKEIFLLPTVRVSNLLQSEIHVLLTETDLRDAICRDKIGNQATIPCGSMVDLYANPAVIYVTVTLTALNTSCKPVNSGDWVKRLNKQKDDVDCLDIDLDFGGGKYFASLRLSRGNRGILEAAIFTSYTLKNDTDFPLLSVPPNQKHLFRDEAEKLRSSIPPELGLFLPPKSTGSWFLRSNKMHVILLEEKASEVLLDLDALSGLTEISLERDGRSGFKKITKLGVALGPCASKVIVPSQIVTIVPRYVIANESDDIIFVRQCNLEDNMEGMIRISSGQKTTLRLQSGISKRRQNNVFENFIRKHSNAIDDSLIYVQFRLNGTGWDWSGPVCIASLGRFFLKFRKSLDFPVQPSQVTGQDNSLSEFAAIHVVEEGSTLVLHFHKPPNLSLPYRIENSLCETSITYYQKDSAEPEVLGPETSVDYVWDNMTLPHKLVVQINDMHLLREINLDKVRPWKSLFKIRQQRGLSFPSPMDKKPGVKRRKIFGDSNGIETIKVGYEVYADGPTRVLRICEYPESPKGNTVFQSSMKIQLRVSSFAIHFLEHGKQDVDANEPSLYTEIIVARLGNISLESLFTDQQKYNQIRVQSLNVDQKWVGAPFAAMLRRHRSDFSDTNDCILHIAFILLSTSSSVKKVKYASIVLQPVDLNLDEETLMRIVPFWRTSLSDSSTPSQQFYFDHFEIHPVKIIASFLPGDSYSSYSSSQETLRSLLHSVIKIPAIKSTVVELNGVLVTHALITMRELFIKCAQHYSWYGMRAVYIAKGSPLLPPSFVSIFDDMASSSLDVFFDPSRGSISLPGLTLGTFKLISKCIDGKGFSGTKRYFGDLGNTLRTAGSNVLFAAVTEISDSVLKGAETNGFNGLVTGFHQGILKLAMEPSLLGSAFMGGGPDRKITLDRSPGVDELYIEGYLQAMLDITYKQEYLRVRVIDNQVFLKNLPPNSSLIDEIMDRVKGFLISKALLKGDSSTSHSLRHLRGETEWKVGPTVLTLCEHLFVSLAIRMLRKQVGKFITTGIKWKEKSESEDDKSIVPATTGAIEEKGKLVWKWGITKFVLSGMVAYIDGRLCRSIPNPVARRIVSGLLLSFLDNNDKE